MKCNWFFWFINAVYRIPWIVLCILWACVSRQLLIHNHKMELKNLRWDSFKSTTGNNIKLLVWLKEYVKSKEKVSLNSAWHNDGSNFSTLVKKTLKIYHVLKDLNYGILKIYAEFWKKIRKKKKSTRRLLKELGASKDTIHRQIKTLAKTYRSCSSIGYLMNWHLNRLSVEWISVVSLSVIPWVIDLSGELSLVMKNGCVSATLTPRNSGSVPVNLPKSLLKRIGLAPK